ncbi:MAG: glycosyltransferase [Cytophagales bacterium]|nr:glycosyltransferase [Cytophagales bacterium]
MTGSNFSAEKGKEQIPRILHYFWDDDPVSSSSSIVRTCYESWKKFAPDFEIKRWDESNFDMGSTEYTQYHFKKKLWAMVSDYIRFYALYTEGGIYLDTDIEIFRPLDGMLVYPFFMGFEDPSLTPDTFPNLGMEIVGSIPAHPFSKQMMEGMERDFARKRVYIVTTRATELSKKGGLAHYGEQDLSDGTHIFPHETFHSFNPLKQLGRGNHQPEHYPSEEAYMAAGRPFIHAAAYAIHWYRGSWWDDLTISYPWYYEWWEKLSANSLYARINGFLKRFWIYRKMKEPINKLISQMEERNPMPSIKPKRGRKKK